MTAIIEYVRYDIPVESREAFKSSYKVALPLLTGLMDINRSPYKVQRERKFPRV
jgi:hypothetical protein